METCCHLNYHHFCIQHLHSFTIIKTCPISHIVNLVSSFATLQSIYSAYSFFLAQMDSVFHEVVLILNITQSPNSLCPILKIHIYLCCVKISGGSSYFFPLIMDYFSFYFMTISKANSQKNFIP